jgi:hypothetical protein
VQAVADTARALGVELQTADIRGPGDLAPAFASFHAGGAEAVNVLASTMLFNFRDEVGRLRARPQIIESTSDRVNMEFTTVLSYHIWWW